MRRDIRSRVLRTLSARVAPATLAAFLATAGAVHAQMPTGMEFRVNTYTTGVQRFGSIAGSFSHLFVVTWESAGQDGSQYGVFAQRYGNGLATTPVGSEFRVNTYTTANQFFPEAASDQAGNFVVVWQSEGQDGSGPGVFGQRFLNSGVPSGAEFRVNTFTGLAQGRPDVSSDNAGFVVVWESAGQDGSDYGIFGQRYTITGVPLGGEFRVNTYTTGPQRAPAVAYGNGDFVVTWESESADDHLLGIRAQRYSGTGVPLGGEFRVNTYTTGNQRSPAVGDVYYGELGIVWQSEGQDGSGEGIFGQRYTAAGSPAGPEFRANTYTLGNQSAPEVNVSGASMVVLWQSELQDGSAAGIYSQKYWGGFPAMPELRVNVTTQGPQTGPAMAYGGWPRWISPWTSDQVPGGVLDVWAMAWVDLPVELQSFTVEEE
jgi:hypothetical protein